MVSVPPLTTLAARAAADKGDVSSSTTLSRSSLGMDIEQIRNVNLADLMKEIDWHMQRCHDSVRSTVDAWIGKHGYATTESARTAAEKAPEPNLLPPIPVPSHCQLPMVEAPDQTAHETQDGFQLPGAVSDEVSDEAMPSKRKDEAHSSIQILASAKPAASHAKKSKTSLVLDLDPQDDESTSMLRRMTESQAYELYSTILILANSIYIGWQTQFLASRAWNSAVNEQPLQKSLPGELLAIQCFFCVLFSADLIMRWAADGFREFWRSADVAWNVLDLIVVTISIMDVVSELVAIMMGATTEKSPLKDFSVLKVLRVVRIVRVAKIIRTMKFFRELRMMVFSIIGSMKSLCWVFLVLGLLFYMFGIAFTSAVTDHFNSIEMWNDPANADLRQQFGTLDRAILSLYMAMSGGNDWGAYFESVSALPGIYVFLYLTFITFSVFAVVNIVTGVFVDSAMQANLVDRDILVHEELEEKKQYLEEVREIFHALDTDSSGTITLEEMESGLQHEKLQAYFRALKLDVSDAAMLFRLLDKDNNQKIPIEEFVNGCYKLQGEATALDTKMTFLEVQTMKERFALMQHSLKELHMSISRYQKNRSA